MILMGICEVGMIDYSKFSTKYKIRRLDDSDVEMILQFCKKNTLYYEYCGMKPTVQQVQNDLHALPPGIEMKDKYYLGFFDGDMLVAVLDYIDGYPESDIGYIGFFMMNVALQCKQIGTAIIRDICIYLKQIGKTCIRLAIAEDNPQANHFWNKNGFAPIKKVPMDGWTAIVAEKTL